MMKNLEFDIFISYSHANNRQKDREGRGWVDHFFEKLQIHFTNVNGNKLKPWLDNKQLVCGDTLSKIAHGGLENSRFFIPILSPPYFKSTWCRKEFLKFAELAKKTSSLDLENFNRILPIIYYPYELLQIEDEEEEQEFEIIKTVLNTGKEQEILYKRFFDVRDHMPRILNPSDPSFDRLCLEFAQELDANLRRVAEVQTAPKIDAPGIFVGLTSGASFEERKSLIKEVVGTRKYKRLNYKLLPEESKYDYDTLEKMTSDKFEKSVMTILKSCNASFHLLDMYYGRTPDDSKLSYLELQYNAATSIAKAEGSTFTCFVYITDPQVTDKRQLKFIEKIERDFEEFPENIIKINADNYKEINETLVTAIIKNNLADQVIQNPGMSQREHLLLLYNSKDENSELVQQIDDYIFERQFEVRKPTLDKRERNMEESEKHLNDSLIKCNKAIIFFGSNATDEWCNAIKIDILKAANTREKCIDKKAICVTDPEVMKRIRKVRSHDFEAINCEDKNYLERIEHFLSS